jgi:hypothetical protein
MYGDACEQPWNYEESLRGIEDEWPLREFSRRARTAYSNLFTTLQEFARLRRFRCGKIFSTPDENSSPGREVKSYALLTIFVIAGQNGAGRSGEFRRRHCILITPSIVRSSSRK